MMSFVLYISRGVSSLSPVVLQGCVAWHIFIGGFYRIASLKRMLL